MSLEAWLAFVGATLVLLAIPGPTVTLVVGYALAKGRASALATALGVALGDFTAMTLSLLGLGALLATSATLFTIVKLAGAAYLVFLGWRLWTAPVSVPGSVLGDPEGTPPFRMALHAFAVTALNPKSLMFFVAFVPQFIDKHADYLPQVGLLVATFVTLALANALAFALAASRARGLLKRPAVLKAVNRVGGGILMGAGASAALTRI